MTNDSHTPGPWVATEEPDETLGNYWRINDDASNRIANVWRNGPLNAEMNARLIAAAPDLLRACSEMVVFCSGVSIEEWSGNLEFEQMRDAIAKAEGR